MPSSEPRDPSVQRNEFARRLGEAMRQRGLTLGRVQAHVEARGEEVSTATLSYWASGRSLPTRARSRTIVRLLEEVLHLPPGHLVEVLPGESVVPPPGAALGRSEVVQAALAEHGIRRNVDRVPLFVHHLSFIGPDRANKAVEHRVLSRSVGSDAQRWAIALTHGPGQLRVEATHGCRVARQIPVEPDLTIVEFCHQHALEAGDTVMSTYRLGCPENGDPVTSSGLGLSSALERAIVEVRFGGEMPHDFRYEFTAPGGEPVEIPRRLHVEGNSVQVGLADAAPGRHSIAWTW